VKSEGHVESHAQLFDRSTTPVLPIGIMGLWVTNGREQAQQQARVERKGARTGYPEFVASVI
jgi:hypothetical protein